MPDPNGLSGCWVLADRKKMKTVLSDRIALPVEDEESLLAHFVRKQSLPGISAVMAADALAVA